MKLRNILATTALVLLAALPANAAIITSLYSTGVDNSGVATTGNSADLHWNLVGGTAYTGGTNGVYPIGPWIAESAMSRWITPTQNATDDVGANSYVFTTTFSLTGFKPATATLSGKFTGDNGVTAIFLNGTKISNGADGFSSFTAFNSGAATFLAGTNTLTFNLRNDGGPAGLRVEVGGTAAVPEPATWGLLVVGFGFVGFAARRRAISIAA